MTSEKFTEGTETFQKNVNSTLKWFQDITTAIIDTQSKQMDFASGIYSSSINQMKKDNFLNSFTGMSEKMMEMMQKNVESILNMADITTKAIMGFAKQTDTTTNSKELLNTLTETFNKQVEMITSVNQKSFDFMTTQLNTPKTAFVPTLEKSKKEFEANFRLSKEAMQEIINMYTKIENPTIETNKKMFNELNEKINSMVNNNVKLWSELMKTYSTTDSLTRNSSGLFKNEHYNGNGSAKANGTKESAKN